MAVFPDNVRAARGHIPIAGRPPTPLRIRGPMQAAMIAGVAWAGLW